MVKLRQKTRHNDVSFSYNKLKDKDSGTDSDEEIFSKNKYKRIEFSVIDKVVEKGDTLQALAIKYHCSVAELKRINNFHNENEIFARRVVKVPQRPFTLPLAGVHISGNSSPERIDEPSTSKIIDIKSLSSKLTDAVSTSNKSEVNEIIFNSQITPNQNNLLSSEDSEENCDERITLIPQSANRIIESDPVVSRLSCNGADADISWKVLIACVVVVIVALPLIYVFYVAEHSESYHYHNHGS